MNIYEKAERYGRTLIKVDSWFPLSPICSNCAIKMARNPSLLGRICTKCQAHHDRDINASRNTLTEGLILETLG